MKTPLENIALVGMGVMGGSFAQALRDQRIFEVKVMGIDPDQEALDRALAEGAISRGERENRTILQEADLVIITLYPFDLIDYIEKNRESFKPGALISDVAGVKGDLLDRVHQVLPPGLDYISGHPMAGRETRGYAYASGQVFKGANYLLMADDRNDPGHVQDLTALLEALGFKRISRVDPVLHDQMIAFTSQLCHVIAVALINSDETPGETIRFVGDSYRDLTRIAKINEDLWPQLFLLNKNPLLEVITAFQDQVTLIKRALEEEDPHILRQVFLEATSRRIDLEETDDKLKNLLAGLED